MKTWHTEAEPDEKAILQPTSRPPTSSDSLIRIRSLFRTQSAQICCNTNYDLAIFWILYLNFLLDMESVTLYENHTKDRLSQYVCQVNWTWAWRDLSLLLTIFASRVLPRKTTTKCWCRNMVNDLKTTNCRSVTPVNILTNPCSLC